MRDKEHPDPAEILTTIIAALRNLTPKEQQKLLDTASTFFGLRETAHASKQSTGLPLRSGGSRAIGGGFSEERSMSPKEFLLQKQPRTDVERVACLAFYLTHYRDMPHFKTIDISKLNTEAAQSKFSNTAMAVENAAKTGYLVPASRGNKQISAAGEVFVQTLPDRDAARSAMAKLRPRRRSHRLTEKPLGAQRKK